jgi:hypothetical protein
MKVNIANDGEETIRKIPESRITPYTLCLIVSKNVLCAIVYIALIDFSTQKT